MRKLGSDIVLQNDKLVRCDYQKTEARNLDLKKNNGG